MTAADTRPNMRQRLSRLVAPQQQVHAEAEHVTAVRLGGTPVVDLVPRHRATVCGTLRSVILRPRAGVPAGWAETILLTGAGSGPRATRVAGMQTNSLR